MRAHTVLSVLRRCLNHWMPGLAVALLLVLGGGTSWAQTAVPTGPDTQPSPAYLPPPDDPDPPAQYDDAAVVSISAPATMTPGSTAYVTVTLRNSGTTTWYPALATYPYRLGSQNPANNSTWGVGRVELGSTVAPGGQVVFGFTITAPTTAGTYSFSWGMLRENLAWFGAIASSTITVSAPAPVYDAQLVSAGVPAQMAVGGNYNVSLTFKNTGNVTWTQSDYRIGSSSPADNTTWGFARVDMGVASVAPGQSATFNFQVHAPATAGTYLFDWGMLYELHWRFGQTSGISVTVGGTNSSVTYIHTDGLGSPVARTDGAGNVISRTRYEPYGYVASGVQPTIGFTGHVNDVDTGLTYMQQRYYDPVAGRFLSIDPVVTDANNANAFNRYVYASNNPYRYIDPDGRWIQIAVAVAIGAVIDVGLQHTVEHKAWRDIDYKGALISGAGAAITGMAGARFAQQAIQGTISATQAVVRTAATGGLLGGTSSAATDAVNGNKVSGAKIVSGAIGGAVGAAVGAKVDNAAAGAVGRLANSGGVASHVAETTRSSTNFGAHVMMGESTGQALGKNVSDVSIGATQKFIEQKAGL